METRRTAVFWAILAAALYALNAPLSKLLLGSVPPTMMAALVLMGAGTFLAALDTEKAGDASAG